MPVAATMTRMKLAVNGTDVEVDDRHTRLGLPTPGAIDDPRND
jgi:hypothetical protein